ARCGPEYIYIPRFDTSPGRRRHRRHSAPSWGQLEPTPPLTPQSTAQQLCLSEQAFCSSRTCLLDGPNHSRCLCRAQSSIWTRALSSSGGGRRLGWLELLAGPWDVLSSRTKPTQAGELITNEEPFQ